MNSKKVWDTEDVHSLKDLLRDPTFAEVMLGRVFHILSIKLGARRQTEDLEGTLRVPRVERPYNKSDVGG